MRPASALVAVAIAAAVGLGLAATRAAADEPLVPPHPFDAAAEAARDCGKAEVDALLAALQGAPSPDAPSPDAVADALFTTARACETRAGDPATALALYQQILRDHPDQRAAVGARLRADALIALIGPDGAGADAARRLALLKTGEVPDDAALAEAAALALERWPGAAEAALWRADRLRELGRMHEAAEAYDDVLSRFADSVSARRAAEGAAAVAIARGEFADARRRIAALPADDPSDRAVRDDLAGQLDQREVRIAWYTRSWIALALALVILLGSLAHAARSPRAVLAALRPPAEVVYAAPIVAVLIATSLTTHIAIGPAVALISGGGLVLAWLSGAGLLAARRAERPGFEVRAFVHVVVTALAVAALAYIAITRGDLLEMIIETVKFGPEG